jgi:aspartate aminotransferase
MKISKKVKAIKPSVTLEISAKAKALKSEGNDVIAFTAGEPDFNTPDYIIDEAEKALRAGKTKYTPTAGVPELRKVIAEKMKRDNGVDCTIDNVVVSSGAKSSLYHVICALIDDGEEVIVPTPSWLTYEEQIALAGGVYVPVKTTQKSGYKLTIEDLEKAITPKSRAILINSPCNPTGVVYNKEELLEIAKVAEKYNLVIISDEIYEELIFDGEKHYSIATLTPYAKENTVIINGVSKSYAMTGWRIGYLVAPKDVAKAVSAMQGHTTSNACTVSQYASVRAIGEKSDFAKDMARKFNVRRELLISELQKISGIKFLPPKGAFYVFIDVSEFYGKSYNGEKVVGSVKFAEILLREKLVAVIPGLAFGDDNCIRISYTVSSADIQKGVSRIAEFLQNLA